MILHVHTQCALLFLLFVVKKNFFYLYTLHNIYTRVYYYLHFIKQYYVAKYYSKYPLSNFNIIFKYI